MHRQQRNAGFSVRKVLRQREGYRCGMCGSLYREEQNAEDCLHLCIYDYLRPPLIETVRDRGVSKFRCRLCHRMHLRLDLAEECADNCKEQWLSTAFPPHMEGLKPIVKERQRYVATGKPQKVKLIPLYRMHKALDDDFQDGELYGESAPGKSEGGEVQAEEKKFRRKSDLKEKFIRQNAQYQCTYCLQLYYTKVEVLACFDSHPEQEEITG